MNKYNVPKKEYENVKQEMNSFSGEGDSGSDIEYYKLSGFLRTNFPEPFLIGVPYVKFIYSVYGARIANPYNLQSKVDEFVAILYLKDVVKSQVETVTSLIEFIKMLEEYDSLLGHTAEETIANFTPITKEEFYDLNNI